MKDRNKSDKVISLSDFKRESAKQDIKRKLFSLTVYSAKQGNKEVYKYSLNGSKLEPLTAEVVLDSLSHLIPDIVGYCEDPAVVHECRETLINKLRGDM